jgi:predicted RNase H-like HicB family nuclease
MLGAVSFCLGAFAFSFGAPVVVALALVVLGFLGVAAWAAAGEPLGIFTSAALERTAWAAAALVAAVLGAAVVFYTTYVPDLPGCIATGESVAEVEREIREAIAFHVEGLREDGLPVPAPASVVNYVDVAA